MCVCQQGHATSCAAMLHLHCTVPSSSVHPPCPQPACLPLQTPSGALSAAMSLGAAGTLAPPSTPAPAATHTSSLVRWSSWSAARTGPCSCCPTIQVSAAREVHRSILLNSGILLQTAVRRCASTESIKGFMCEFRPGLPDSSLPSK